MKFSSSRFPVFSFSRLLILSVAAALLIPHASAQVVEIPDPNFRRAVRERLELSDEVPITQTEMLRLKRLIAKKAQIEDLTGLEYATNLNHLVLSANEIQDITSLARLVNLDSLNLQKNPITDLFPLSHLTQLTYLNLVGVPIKGLTPLANLAQLKELHLGDCQITDLTPLSNLTQLIVLNLSNNQIVDVSPLANLIQLTDLTIANNPITDYSPLFGLNLQNVDIDIHKSHELASRNVEILDPNLKRAVRERLALPDTTPITQLQMLRLEKLIAKKAKIENITGLEHAINLKLLVLDANNIQDITPVINLVNLNSLTLAENNIQDITPVTNLVDLNSLTLRDNPIEDISPIANLTKLTGLNISGVIIKDLTPLSNLTQLRELYATRCQITDITPLANLTQLVVLNLRANQIVDVTPLVNLTQLETLRIAKNRIVDFTPLQGLPLTDFRYDEECLLPDLPILDRIQNRNLPSLFQGWGDATVNLSHLPLEERIAYHDIHWARRPFALRFQLTPQGYQVKGDLALAIAKREAMASRNPNMLFLRTIRQRDAQVNHHYPEDWPYWLRDEEGNLIPGSLRNPDVYLIDTTDPGLQDIIVQQAIASAKCGLYDGIFFDWWGESAVLVNYLVDPPIFYKTHEEEREARISILERIRANVPDDFLIVCNLGERAKPIAASHINGSFMELDPDDPERGFTRDEIIVIENNLIWREENLREPQLNCLRGVGILTEPYESPINKRVMRLFTTMSLTLSDGYVQLVHGIVGEHVNFWYRFWDADLGQPIGPTAKRYQDDIDGLYIREFTNGWAVYNRSGKAQTISLQESATGVSSGESGITHLLPDLDGEMYLKAPNPADVNGDGKVNILDLVQVANNFGQSTPDPNGDGVVNILDLVFVAQQFSQ